MDVEQQHILAGVDSIYFYYFDGATWKESWTTNETYRLPRAVKVEISLAGKQSEPVTVVVPLIDSGTNSTSVASAQ
jgi:hypothetical protein